MRMFFKCILIFLLASLVCSLNSEEQLLNAAEKGKLDEVVDLIFEGDLDLNYFIEEDGKTALIKASEGGHLHIVQALLAQKEKGNIEVNAVDVEGHDALYYAADLGFLEIVKELLPHATDDSGNKALIRASLHGHTDIVEAILTSPKISINVNSKDGYGNSALINATKKNHLKVAKMLLSRKEVDVNITDSFTWTPLYYAVMKNYVEMTTLLIQHKNIEINTLYKLQGSVLIIAARSGNVDSLKLLLIHKYLLINEPDSDGRTALHWATIEGKTEAVEALLSAKEIDVDILDKDGQTALFYALDDESIAKLLLFTGKFNLDHKNSSGKTILDICTNENVIKMINLMVMINNFVSTSSSTPPPPPPPPPTTTTPETTLKSLSSSQTNTQLQTVPSTTGTKSWIFVSILSALFAFLTILGISWYFLYHRHRMSKEDFE
jgi:ankyrin repeat domain-containing protein 50